jgi:two-component system chemotaxis response regulator CheY
MTKLNIICIDDQREVLAALRKDLEPLEQYCAVEACESADEALEVMEELDDHGKQVAVIISDHVMPGQSGIEFLTDINYDSRFSGACKLLLTGMATHQDTIVAINEANIDRYIEKPWDIDTLVRMVKELLTKYVLRAGIAYQPFLPVLDQKKLYESLRRAGI